ncbi:membrane-bound lytic murein transglycosylase F [Alteromonadaceae bacterium 2753L.S.0a.02]|nr:membrane-bound lytic murein transglycosylase F [Alteromonadaceae bacterium 2753L.S.0a.02]
MLLLNSRHSHHKYVFVKHVFTGAFTNNCVMAKRLFFKQLKLTGIILVCLLTTLQIGCSKVPAPQNTETEPGPPTFKNYTETGDFTALQERGVVRLLAPRWEDTGLPREGLPNHGYRELAEQFVASLGLKIQWLAADNHSDLITMLESGKGDIIVTHLTHTDAREQHIAFTLPVSRAFEQVVSTQEGLTEPAKLKNKHFAVGKGTSYSETLHAYAAQHPELKIHISELDNGDPEYLLDKIAAGKFDATIMDDNQAKALASYREDTHIGANLTPTRPIAWATRKNSPELLSRLNNFLTESRITQIRSKRSNDDFDVIKKRKVLRIITRNSAATYFLWRGELMGYEYDLMKKFADRQGLRLEVEVAPPGTDMISMLKSGEGDVIAANMTITENRRLRGISFTHHYHITNEQLVSRKQAQSLDTLENLKGRTLVVRPDTAYWQTAQHLLDSGYELKLQAAPADQTTAEILSAVAQGNYDATIADSHLVGIEANFDDDLVPGLMLEETRKLGWAVRAENPLLLEALNKYIKLHYRGKFFNVTYNKYFRNESRIDKYQGQRLLHGEILSPYDDIVKPLAVRYQFDWRMLVSQMYQESKFNPRAKSFAGAVGLFQVMPRTARELGFKLPLTPETGIHAGIKYLDWTRERFEAHLPLEERLWFALAAYNAGFGHVNDARRLARQKGWQGDVWFGNVEAAMLLLSKREYYNKARFGYVRGTEPVNYVRKIKDRYYAYLGL